MKLQDQVCSLEHAKKLKELGVKQDVSIFTFYEVSDGDEGNPDREFHPVICVDISEGSIRAMTHVDSNWTTSDGEFADFKEPASAFTVGELGAMLSAFMDKDQDLPDYLCNPDAKISDTYKPAFIADMLIGLLEGNYLTVDEVNERLAA